MVAASPWRQNVSQTFRHGFWTPSADRRGNGPTSNASVRASATTTIDNVAGG